MKRRVIASLTDLLWALWAVLSYHLTAGVIEQHAPGYPSAEQWRYYVYFAVAMLLINLGLLAAGRKLPATLFATAIVLQMIVFIPFFLGFTGGM